jgi:hypothetical protein
VFALLVLRAADGGNQHEETGPLFSITKLLALSPCFCALAPVSSSLSSLFAKQSSSKKEERQKCGEKVSVYVIFK